MRTHRPPRDERESRDALVCADIDVFHRAAPRVGAVRRARKRRGSVGGGECVECACARAAGAGGAVDVDALVDAERGVLEQASDVQREQLERVW